MIFMFAKEVIQLIRDIALRRGEDPDEAECMACELYPRLKGASKRMRATRLRAIERAKKQTL